MLSIHLKPYENEFSTALSECKAVARCATRKTDAAMNRIKTVVVLKLGIEKREEREIQQDTTDKKSQITKRDIKYDKKYI